ncbi:hypothetical protein EIP86_006814 [Pleurotus ostreatoroseus]|nr:hypothetical protein EIP86_006814 [Pleurotus ostreatoroseus]
MGVADVQPGFCRVQADKNLCTAGMPQNGDTVVQQVQNHPHEWLCDIEDGMKILFSNTKDSEIAKLDEGIRKYGRLTDKIFTKTPMVKRSGPPSTTNSRTPITEDVPAVPIPVVTLDNINVYPKDLPSTPKLSSKSTPSLNDLD